MDSRWEHSIEASPTVGVLDSDRMVVHVPEAHKLVYKSVALARASPSLEVHILVVWVQVSLSLEVYKPVVLAQVSPFSEAPLSLEVYKLVALAQASPSLEVHTLVVWVQASLSLEVPKVGVVRVTTPSSNTSKCVVDIIESWLSMVP
ncbi:Dimethylamine corrinoid 2 [Gossypium australe]|uniref:Dimethylamine corrinoid 2 n=1 Tax=Gossypium australe TaxID=47621 RepID=A0A5B6WU12_9ROSI|nr:Dimethylamine corrinoid 2 [Gossypium australe]